MNKIIWLGIAICALGIIILPETISLFQGQHTFYDLKSVQGVPCLKCHADVQSQMTLNTPHSEFKCGDCHKINMIEQGTHAATVPLCMDCHGGQLHVGGILDPHKMGNPTNCIKCHGTMPMNNGSQLNVTASINSINEPHRTFISGANSDNMMRGSNEACIGCHTATSVNITWNKPTTMTMNVERINGVYIVNNFSER